MDIQNTGNAPGVEIVNCIKEAGLSPDIADLSQLAGAVKLLGGLSREEIQAMIDAAMDKAVEKAVSEAVKQASRYNLCEFYFFRNPALRPGFRPAQGDLLENAAALYPEAWAYLQTAEGQALCVTEEEWQAMTHATWATLADGTKVGWDGIGGAPFFALHTDTGALRLPDIRGMYPEVAGFDGLDVGGVHGDTDRPAEGNVSLGSSAEGGTQLVGSWHGSGPFVADASPGSGDYRVSSAASTVHYRAMKFDMARIKPVGNKIAPRAWGVLGCVYLGKPAA